MENEIVRSDSEQLNGHLAMFTPLDRLTTTNVFLQDDTNDQWHAEQTNQNGEENFIDHQLIGDEVRILVQAERRTPGLRVSETVCTGREENRHAVEKTTIEKNQTNREIMAQQAFPSRRSPIAIEDQNMPFDRCPRYEDSDRFMNTITEYPPEQTDTRWFWPHVAETKVIQIQWHVSDQIEKLQNNQNDHHMIVQTVSKFSNSEEIVKKKNATANRKNTAWE